MDSSTETIHAMLSYSWKDSDVVDRVQADLEAKGFTVWRDKSRLTSGSQYGREIEAAAQRCVIMLVFGSPQYEESVAKGEGCAPEVQLAIQRMREGRPVLGLNVGPAGYNPVS